MGVDLELGALLVILVAVSLGAVAKGVTGMGLPMIGIPVMASFLGVERAVLVMAIPTLVTNCWLLWAFRSHVRETRHLGVLLVLGLATTIPGTVLLTRIDPAIPATVLGLLIVSYLVLLLVRPSFQLSERAGARAAPVVGVVGGALHGATGVSGPVFSTFLHCLGLSRGAFVFSITAVFQVAGLAQIVTFFSVGSYDGASLLQSLVAMAPIAVMFPLGIWLGGRISAQAFDRAVRVLLLAMAIKLLYDGITGL